MYRRLGEITRLSVSDCQLVHKEPQNSVDFLCQNITTKGGIVTIQIPICIECMYYLYNEPDWVLLYCLNCTESHWTNKKHSTKKHLYLKNEKIKWLNNCPKCKKGENYDKT